MLAVIKHVGLFLGLLVWLGVGHAVAHGDVTPRAVDTSSLPQLGKDWVANPYRGNAEAVTVGAEGYIHNCAGCHGLNAVSGGVAPDLLKLVTECVNMSKSAQASCLKETDDYFKDIVLDGKKNSEGRYTMPGYGAVFTQEAVWAVKAYLDKRTFEEAAKK